MQSLLALLAGVLMLLVPRALNYIVAAYLILAGTVKDGEAVRVSVNKQGLEIKPLRRKAA